MEVKIKSVLSMLLQFLLCAVIERGSFTVKDLCNSDISVVANTSLEECSNVAVLVIDRVRNNDMRFATRMTTVIGEGVLEFSGSTDQHMCKAHIKLPSGLRLSFPSFNCGTSKINIYYY